MPTLQVRHHHNAGLDKAKEVAEAVAIRISEAYDIDYHWDGDDVIFERAGISGLIRIDDQNIEFDAKMNMIVGMFKNQIEQAIRDELDTAFT